MNGWVEYFVKIMIKAILLLILISTISCQKNNSNYNLVSEMNTLHPIEIIYVDEKTQRKLGEFPFDRKHHAMLIENIQQENPAAVILKFFFDSKSENDVVLAETLIKYSNIFSQIDVKNSAEEYINSDDLLRFSVNADSTFHGEKSFTLPNQTLLKGFDGLGIVTADLNKKQQLQGFHIAETSQGVSIPNISISVIKKLVSSSVELKNSSLFIGNKEIQFGNSKYLPLDLSKPMALYKSHSYLDILNSSKNNFQNKIIIIYIEDPAVRYIESEYRSQHNNAELVADSINTLLKAIQ